MRLWLVMVSRSWLEPEGVRFLQCYNASSRAARTTEVCCEAGAGFRLLVESGVSFGLENLLHFAMSAFSVSFFCSRTCLQRVQHDAVENQGCSSQVWVPHHSEARLWQDRNMSERIVSRTGSTGSQEILRPQGLWKLSQCPCHLPRLVEQCPQQVEGMASAILSDVSSIARHPYGNYAAGRKKRNGMEDAAKSVAV